MNKKYASLLSFVALGVVSTEGFAATKNESLSSEQVKHVEKVIATYLQAHPEAVTSALEAAQKKQQEEEVAKMKAAVLENKVALFEDEQTPVVGNPEGSQSLVVFVDPYCGYCRKFHQEFSKLKENKDLKILVNDIPIMGEPSIEAIKALLAAKEQDKYEEFQSAVFGLKEPADLKGLEKIAKDLGLDLKKFKEAMKGSVIKERLEKLQKLGKDLGVSGTPTLIINETEVVPGYMSADELAKKFKAEADQPSEAE